MSIAERNTQYTICEVERTQLNLFFAWMHSCIFDYEAHVNTKIDYFINQVFETMSVAEYNILLTSSEVEPLQPLTKCL